MIALKIPSFNYVEPFIKLLIVINPPFLC